MWIKQRFSERDILIFLDIDGVLNTSNSFNTKYEISEKNIEVLKQLIGKLSKHNYLSKIVLTSTWRLGYDADFQKCSPQIQALIRKLGCFSIQIFDKTPVYKEKTRDVEILRYIKGYRLKNKDFNYLILDDDVSVFDKAVLNKLNFYKVNQCTGLIKEDIARIMKIIT